jgi:putative ABC transport system permease protein
MLGAVATLLGLFTGVLLARALSGISTAGLEVPGAIPALTSWVVLKAALSGIVVSCLGGWMACRHEWSTANAGRPSALWSWIGALVLMGLLVMGVALPASGLFGGFAAVLAVSLLAVFCVRPLLEHLRATGVRLRGALLVRIGLREVTWYPRDLSIAVGALALAIGTSMGVGLMVESFREDFSSMLDQRLAHDVFIDGAGADLHAVAAWLARQPGTPRVQAYGSSRARLHGYPIVLGYTDFSAREAARYGMARGLGLDEALISERTAARLALGVDDVVAVKGRTLRIVAVFRGFGDVGLRLLVDSATAERMGVAPLYDRLSVSGDALSGLDDRLLERFAGTYPGLRVQPRSDMRSLALDIFDRTFAITRALTLLALLVAVIGMYNALLALRLNQAPSYVLLDALGVGIWEQRWIALRRAGAVGALAVVLALPLGIALGWLLCNVINPRAFGWSLSLQLSAAELLIPVGLGLLAAGVAGILPLPREGEGIADGA